MSAQQPQGPWEPQPYEPERPDFVPMGRPRPDERPGTADWETPPTAPPEPGPEPAAPEFEPGSAPGTGPATPATGLSMPGHQGMAGTGYGGAQSMDPGAPAGMALGGTPGRQGGAFGSPGGTPGPRGGMPGSQGPAGPGWQGPARPGSGAPWGVAPDAEPVRRRGPVWTARRSLAAAGVAVALAIGAGGAGAAIAMAVTGDRTVQAGPTAVAGASLRTGTVAQVAAAVQPSVVSIQTRSAQGSGTGSGVILRQDGVIMTNAHVVADAEQVTVKFSDGRTAAARVLGADTGHDIAVVKAQGVSGLKAATLGDSSALAVGDQVLAVGSPLGLDGSVTSGIVSALGRRIQEGDSGGDQQLPPGLRRQVAQTPQAVIENAIQTDAAINPGNSGGALVNSAGQVIGVNSAIATSGGSGNIGVGFAIPVNDARKVAERIIATGSV